MVSNTLQSYRRKGQPRNTLQSWYRCPNYLHGNHAEGCTRQIWAKRLDVELWRKVMSVLNGESDFEDRVHARVEELRREGANAESSIERIKRELGQLTEERQWVITQGRKKIITEADVEQQLSVLDAEAQDLRRDLGDKSLLIGDRAGRLIAFAKNYREDIRAKLEWLNKEPQDDVERKKQFKARREIVEAIVRKVNVKQNMTVEVELEFELSGIDEKNQRPSTLVTSM